MSDAPFVADKPKKKWLIIGVVVAAVVVGGALAIGLGVGLGQKKKEVTAETVTDPATKTIGSADTGPTPNVRYIRILRVEPSNQKENIINISELSVYGAGMKLLPLVDGTVYPLWDNNPNYNWNQLKDGILAGFASTTNSPDSRITVDLGSAQTVHEIVVNNRTDAGTNRIIGCQLLLLDGNERVLNEWAFKDVGKVYKVGVSTSMKLVAVS